MKQTKELRALVEALKQANHPVDADNIERHGHRFIEQGDQTMIRRTLTTGYMILYKGARCTLDGRQAIIVAGMNEAQVCQTPFGLTVPFAWATVHRIMQKGSKFKLPYKELKESIQ